MAEVKFQNIFWLSAYSLVEVIEPSEEKWHTRKGNHSLMNETEQSINDRLVLYFVVLYHMHIKLVSHSFHKSIELLECA